MLLFESFNDIHSWCDSYDITNYTINNDGSIDVNGDVHLFNLNIPDTNLLTKSSSDE